MTEIGILVVTYNQYDITRNFILNFQKYFSHDGYYLLILDNNSSDLTFEKIKSEFPAIDIRKLNGNYGCVTGRNIGIVELIKAGVKYIYVSDNDIIFKDDTIFEKLKEFVLRHPQIDGCCPVVKWPSGETIQTVGARYLSWGRIKYINETEEGNDINILPGCAQFLKTDAFKKYGLYDNDLTPISIEDLEWGIRASKNGARFKFNSQTEVIHLHNIGKKATKESMKYIISGRVIFLRKYFNIFFLLREIRHFIQCTVDFGFLFTLKNYKEGYNRKVNPNNYDLINFMDDVNKYYK